MTVVDKPVVALVSLGCPKNLVDSEKILGLLAEAGCVAGAEPEQADVVIVNTCGFLAAAREESLAVIRQALRLKSARRVRRVVVAGCLAQRDGRKLLELAPGVDAVVGVNDRDELVQAVLGEGPFLAARRYRRGAAVADDTARLRLTARHTAYLRISEGCGQGCTFCTIPAIRGPFRSKPPQQVLSEAAELVADGALELNLIGQDTTSYGRDIGYARGLAGLLRELNALPGVRWIRLMYAYPSLLSDEILDALAGCDRVVKYLDVPLQHIAEPVLKAMRRRITGRQSRELLERVRRRVPGIALRTTFIVGFPGETRRDFEELLDFVREARFEAAGVFEYSKEPGTPAARLRQTVPAREKRRRREALMLAQQQVAFAAADERVGQELEVLVDGVGPDGACVGRHAGQAPEVDSLCRLSSYRRAGQFVRATVVAADGYDLLVRPRRAGR